MLEKDDQIGEYKLVKFLGKGQFGEVWLAEKKLKISKRKVRHALKFLSGREEEIDFEAAEAEIDTWIEASGHPNVMSVLDMLVYKEHMVIVSEYAEAGSLRQWLKRHDGKAATNVKAIEIMLGILRGIEHLHSRNVVHRDLKPDNILLQGNFPRITDFGISRIVSENATSTMAIGSPAYMSPEAFLGNKLPQTDIWSAGVVLFELVSGNLPFTAESVYQLKDIIQQDEPHSLPENVPLELRRIIRKSLQKECRNRFQTAQAMREELEAALYDLASKNKRLKTQITDPQKSILTQAIADKSNDPTASFTPEPVNSREFEQTETLSQEKVGINTLPSRVNLNSLNFPDKAEDPQFYTETSKNNLATGKSEVKVRTESNFWLGLGVSGLVGLALGVYGIFFLVSFFSAPTTSNDLSNRNPYSPKNTSTNLLPNGSINNKVSGSPKEDTSVERIEELESRLNILEESAGRPISERIEVFYSELNKDSTAGGVIMNYGTDREVARREAEIRKAIISRNFNISRVKFVRGGAQPGIRTRFFIVPPGAAAPTP